MQSEDNKVWDPRNFDYTLGRLTYYLAATIFKVIDEFQIIDESEAILSRTELDSNANMAVVGHSTTIISRSGHKVDVSPFTHVYQPMAVEVVDATLQYESLYTNIVAMMVIWNALYVPTMAHKLIPPFMMQEAGVQVSSTPKIQVSNPSLDNH